jgi:hypothetical protein
MREFLKTQFDKLLLASLMLVFLVVILHLVHDTPEPTKAIDWAINAFSALSGALLGLITGTRLAQRPDPTSSVTSTTVRSVEVQEEPHAGS